MSGYSGQSAGGQNIGASIGQNIGQAPYQFPMQGVGGQAQPMGVINPNVQRQAGGFGLSPQLLMQIAALQNRNPHFSPQIAPQIAPQIQQRIGISSIAPTTRYGYSVPATSNNPYQYTR